MKFPLGVLLVAAALVISSYLVTVNAQTFGTQRAGIFQPAGATPITASAVGTTGATTATLPADSPGLRNTYICGFQIRATATSSTVGNSTVTGTVGGTLNFSQFTQALATSITPVDVSFTPCVPSSAPATAIVVTSAAAGAGGVVSVAAWGYQY